MCLSQVPVVLLIVASIVLKTKQNRSYNATLEGHSLVQKGAKNRGTSLEITGKCITHAHVSFLTISLNFVML